MFRFSRIKRSVKKCLLWTFGLLVLGQPLWMFISSDSHIIPTPEVEEDVSLLVLIHATSKEVGKERRDIIRRTWASKHVVESIKNAFGKKLAYNNKEQAFVQTLRGDLNIQRFVLGSKGLTIDMKLDMEQKENKDMIFLDQVTDEHATLTQRTLDSFVYIVNKDYKFSHMLKCDDDSVVDLKQIVIYLQNISWTDRLYWGDFVGAQTVLQDGIYAEHNWYICDDYIPYAFGGGYVVSRDLIELIVRNSPHLLLYKNEDVSIASWLLPYNFIRVHDQRFDTGSNSENCKKSFIVVHKVSPKKMQLYYRSLLKEGHLCGRQMEYYGGWNSHKYNWNNLPSQCCEADVDDEHNLADEILIF